MWQRDRRPAELVEQDRTRRPRRPCATCQKSTRSPGSRKTPWAPSRGCRRPLPKKLRQPGNWWSIIGVIGMLIAFGHSILAMSGEETLAQVYREVESPKLPQFQEGGIHRLRLQPAADGGHLVPGRAADSRRNPHEGLFRQPDRRTGDARHRPAAGPAAAERLRGRGRFPDPGGRGQHGDHRLERRAEPGGRRRRLAQLVPEAASPLRHDASRSFI